MSDAEDGFDAAEPLPPLRQPDKIRYRRAADKSSRKLVWQAKHLAQQTNRLCFNFWGDRIFIGGRILVINGR